MNLLVAGVDPDDGPQLFYMDHLASMVKVRPLFPCSAWAVSLFHTPCFPNIFPQLDFGVHGYGGFFALSTMDRYFKANMTLEEVCVCVCVCVCMRERRSGEERPHTHTHTHTHMH